MIIRVGLSLIFYFFIIGCSSNRIYQRQAEVLPTYEIYNLNVQKDKTTTKDKFYVYPKVIAMEKKYWQPKSIEEMISELDSEFTGKIKLQLLGKFIDSVEIEKLSENNSRLRWDFTNYLY